MKKLNKTLDFFTLDINVDKMKELKTDVKAILQFFSDGTYTIYIDRNVYFYFVAFSGDKLPIKFTIKELEKSFFDNVIYKNDDKKYHWFIGEWIDKNV